MGVTYKLRDEVVHFIISQRQGNPLSSCRQLAESASQKFGLRLSKSSVHDVLKESGIVTPRGRKPKDKFQIPQERKKQIQGSLSQIKLLSFNEKTMNLPPQAENSPEPRPNAPETEIAPEYEGAGKIFLKAVYWDLGIFSTEGIKESDWDYYLTYCKGIRVSLEGDRNFFIDFPVAIERCIREAVDGLINNVRPLTIDKTSDDALFEACMGAKEGFKIQKISIVDGKDHVLSDFTNLVDCKRHFIRNRMVFVENKENNLLERANAIFFPQLHEKKEVMQEILNLRGFDRINETENNISLILAEHYENKMDVLQAIERLNGMYLHDEKGRLVKVNPVEKEQ